MYKDFARAFRSWRDSTSRLKMLQASYLAIGVTSLVVAGLISLLNRSAGEVVLIVSKISFLTFIVNATLSSFLPTADPKDTKANKNK